ncbi:ABC transporter permease [Pelobium sp.]|nr:FtsX-like permease family protein [Pelobium sp.]MDA9555041.1 ABC transporter permease [Pelobium sp.]
MNLELFIARRISLRAERTFSKLIVRIAIVGIMLGLGVMLLSIAIVKGFKAEIREKVRGFNGDIQYLKYDLNSSYENSPFSLSQKVLVQTASFKEVEHLAPFATKPGIIKANNEVEGVILKGVDKQYDWSYFNKILVSGKTIDFADSTKASKQIIISDLLAKRLNLKVGDDFLMYFVQESLRKRKFEIVGIYNTGVEEVDKTYVIGDISLIRKLNNWENIEAGGYEIRIKDFNNLDQSAVDLSDFLPPQIKTVSVKESYPVIFDWLSLLDINAQVILVLMLIVAVINMVSALLIMILERTNMIGLLKALGETNWGVRKIFLYNAAYLVGFGMVLGNVFGLGLGYIQQKTHVFKLDEASYYMKFVPIQFGVWDILLINLGTLLICLLVLIIPSVLVTKISPVKAIAFK